ncbi:MAG: glycosyltransferase [Promethearchaeota archaeon]|nr:MAG: glycosyltransferase [Candidatus Lokiarchaeota archaeon]
MLKNSKKNRKLLFIIPSLEIGGGAERRVALLSKYLFEKYKINTLTFYDVTPKYNYRGRYYSLNLKRGSFKRILIPFKLFQYITKIKPDLIISFIDYTNFILIALKKIFRFKIPLISYVSGNPKMAFQNQLKYHNLLIRFIYPSKAVNRIITVSEDIKKDLIREYGIKKDKIKTIYNAIDVNRISKLSKNEIMNNNDVFRDQNLIKFITMGRLNHLKRHEYLIKAFIRVKRKVPNSKLIIIGNGPLELNLKNIVYIREMNDSIIFLGLVKNPFKYLASSDIFILTSLYEGFPNAILEAMMCGLPVISTNCETGPQEILKKGKYGILVDVNNMNELIKKMIEISKNKAQRLKYAYKAKQRARDFDIKTIIKQWEKIIDSLLY